MKPQSNILRFSLASLLPVALLYFLRHLVHSVLGDNCTSIGIHSRDVIFPLCLGGWISFVYSQFKNPLPLRFHKDAFITLAISLGAVSLLLGSYDALVSRWGPVASVLLLMGMGALSFFSSFFVFITLADYRHRIQLAGNRTLYGAAAILMLVNYRDILTLSWPYVSHATGEAVFFLLKIFGSDVRTLFVGHSIRIAHPDIIVSMGMGCSGLEGSFFFLFALCLFFMFQKKTIRVSRLFYLGIFGSAILFVITLVRTVGSFVLAVGLNRWERGLGSVFFEWSIHQNVGWILYFAAIVLILRRANIALNS